MPIVKKLTLDATGGEASHHVIRSINLDLVAKTSNIVLTSYVSAETYSMGLHPASFQMISVPVDGLPEKGQDPVEFAEAALVKDKPADTVAHGNRYLFAGGIVVP